MDPTADLFRQLRRLISESVAEHLANAKKQRWIAERGAGTITQLVPVIGTLKFVLETLGSLPALVADDVDSYRLEERKRAFEALTPGRQRSYLYHFGAAKQAATRRARIDKAMPAIFEGRGFLERR